MRWLSQRVRGGGAAGAGGEGSGGGAGEPEQASLRAGSDRERDVLEDVVRIQHTSAPLSGGGAYPGSGPTSPLKALGGGLAGVAADLTAAVDTLRHIIQEPKDAAAHLCGSMMSKDYGDHEPPHTEHHIYRGPAQPQGGSPQQRARAGRGGRDASGGGGASGSGSGGGGGSREGE